MSQINKAMSKYYNGPFYSQSGGGIMDWINKGNAWLKENKIISKGDQLAQLLGFAPTDPRYQAIMNMAKQKGYGKKTRSKGKGKHKK